MGHAVCKERTRGTESPKPARVASTPWPKDGGLAFTPTLRRRPLRRPGRVRSAWVLLDTPDTAGTRTRGHSGHTPVGHADTPVCLFRSTSTYGEDRSASGRLTSPAGGARGPNHWRLWHRAGVAGAREVHAAEEGLETRVGRPTSEARRSSPRCTTAGRSRFVRGGRSRTTRSAGPQLPCETQTSVILLPGCGPPTGSPRDETGRVNAFETT